MLPAKAAIGADGVLYVDYASGIGPNGADNGAVWKLDTRGGVDRHHSGSRRRDRGRVHGPKPRPAASRPRRGLDSRPLESSRHRAAPNDAGAHWTSLREHSRRDESAVPWLDFDHGEFGGWISGLAFDPFDGGTLAYTTGATLYRTGDALKPELLWEPWVKGVEETVPMDLISPAAARI